MQDALYLTPSFKVCPTPKWSEKENLAEDNLPQNNYCTAFWLKKIICLVSQLGKKGLPVRDLPTQPLLTWCWTEERNDCAEAVIWICEKR